eukprot:6212330-Pleurochrysis_carterae.AAC.1
MGEGACEMRSAEDGIWMRRRQIREGLNKTRVREASNLTLGPSAATGVYIGLSEAEKHPLEAGYQPMASLTDTSCAHARREPAIGAEDLIVECGAERQCNRCFACGSARVCLSVRCVDVSVCVWGGWRGCSRGAGVKSLEGSGVRLEHACNGEGVGADGWIDGGDEGGHEGRARSRCSEKLLRCSFSDRGAAARRGRALRHSQQGRQARLRHAPRRGAEAGYARRARAARAREIPEGLGFRREQGAQAQGASARMRGRARERKAETKETFRLRACGVGACVVHTTAQMAIHAHGRRTRHATTQRCTQPRTS